MKEKYIFTNAECFDPPTEVESNLEKGVAGFGKLSYKSMPDCHDPHSLKCGLFHELDYKYKLYAEVSLGVEGWFKYPVEYPYKQKTLLFVDAIDMSIRCKHTIALSLQPCSFF